MISKVQAWTFLKAVIDRCLRKQHLMLLCCSDFCLSCRTWQGMYAAQLTPEEDTGAHWRSWLMTIGLLGMTTSASSSTPSCSCIVAILPLGMPKPWRRGPIPFILHAGCEGLRYRAAGGATGSLVEWGFDRPAEAACDAVCEDLLRY